ncbi:MAG TPA: adenosine deaminase [Jatrophihabitans sp.]|nr:adenosine deaminase [Jatrophihabitans sp.]
MNRQPDSIDGFLAGLPKVELHLHLIGSITADTLLTLARRHPDGGVPGDPDALSRWLTFADFPQFCAAFGRVSRLVTDGDDLVALVTGMAGALAVSKVRYAEVTVTPLTHLAVGVRPDELADALTLGRERAARESGVELGWIFDVSGDLGPPAADDTLAWVLAHQPDGTVGFGLGGPERDVPRAAFRDAFDRAVAAGLHSVPHAGETDGAHSVWSALRDLRAERIGHGIRSIDDPRLVEQLAASGVPLEVCPTSNACTGAASISDHPLPALLAAGVRVTLATDNPGLFNTDLGQQYRLCHDVLGLGRSQLVELARAGVQAAFCPPASRRRILDEIDRYVEETDPYVEETGPYVDETDRSVSEADRFVSADRQCPGPRG